MTRGLARISISVFLCSLSLLHADEQVATKKKQAGDALAERAQAVVATMDGRVSLPGLKEPVEILRDRWGVAHIYAKNSDDLFFAQGFVAAQDRLFQIDWWRRLGAGEIAEVVGESGLAADRFARLIRYRGDMAAEWKSYSPDTMQIATAFTSGINAYIDHIGKNLPIEFQVLGHTPKKWRPEDVLGRMSGIYMSQNFRNEIARAQLIAAVGLEKARWLAPVDPARDFGPAAGLELSGIDQRVLADYAAAVKWLAYQPATTQSNNWVVAAERSASGKPLLASDPHRAIALPSLRYLVHLHAPGWNVIGSGEPGLPGVALGHNERIAWGFTIIGTDQADFFVEETDPKRPEHYKVGDRWEPMTIVREKVRVKGKAHAQPIELRYTRHGPVLFQDEKTHRAFALKWSGSEPGGAAYLGSLAVARAQNQKEFLKALASWKIPGLNFVYADVDGNIGWVAAALTPMRKHDGLLPVPGNAGFEWQGYLSVADLPQSFNPKRGFIATANHNILPPGYTRQIGYEFAPPYRFQRVEANLAAKKTWQLKDFKAVQHDHVSIPGQTLGRLLKGIDLEDKTLEPWARLLIDWDGALSVDAKAGPLYAAWLKEIQDTLLGLHVPKKLHATINSIVPLPVLLAALEKGDVNWLGTKERARVIQETFARAVARATKMPPTWGELHTVTFKHPLSTLSPAHARVFDLGPLPRPGDGNTPNNTRYDDKFKQIHGASYRHLLDLADWDNGLATSTPGQSGQPGSEHYADLLPLWQKGEYFPLAYSRKKVEEVTKHRLVLDPAGK